MPRRSKKPVRKQTHSPTGKVVGQVGQILLPMIAGIAATKADLTEWVYEQGLTALPSCPKTQTNSRSARRGHFDRHQPVASCAFYLFIRRAPNLISLRSAGTMPA